MKAVGADLLDLVWQNEEWIKSIFDVAKSTVTNYNVEAMVMQLLAAGLMDIRRRDDVWYYVVAKMDHLRHNSTYRFENEENWEGIYLLPESTQWRYNLDL